MRRRAIRDGVILTGLIFNAQFLIFWLPRLDLWIDAHAWARIDLDRLYEWGAGSLAAVGAFRYSPVAAWLMYPLSTISWQSLITVLTVLNLIAVSVLVRRKAVLFVLAFPPVLLEIFNGNIQLLLAVAIYAGMRWPAAWAVVLLTKVTPGIGIIWFAAREEWRNLGLALGTTMAIVIAGVILVPDQWLQWVWSLTLAAEAQQLSDIPSLPIRVLAAAVVVWFAARTDRAWLVPFACVIAMPTIWIQSSAYLLASFPLYWERERWVRPRHRLQPPIAEAAT